MVRAALLGSWQPVDGDQVLDLPEVGVAGHNGGRLSLRERGCKAISVAHAVDALERGRRQRQRTIYVNEFNASAWARTRTSSVRC